MTTPTREQVIADMQALGVPDLWLATLTDRAFEFIAKAAEHYTTAGRDQGLREAMEVCEADGFVEQFRGLNEAARRIEQLRGK